MLRRVNSNTPDFFDPDQVGSKSGVLRLKFWALSSVNAREKDTQSLKLKSYDMKASEVKTDLLCYHTRLHFICVANSWYLSIPRLRDRSLQKFGHMAGRLVHRLDQHTESLSKY